MKVFEPVVMRTTVDQRRRFFESLLWKDIEDVVESYRVRELEIMAAPEDFNEPDLDVNRARGRIEVLRGICQTLRAAMFDELVEDVNLKEDEE